MDRPEWGAVDPNSGEVYFTLTNNSRRTQAQVDAANPRAENNFGQIIRWREAGDDHPRGLRVGPVRDRRHGAAVGDLRRPGADDDNIFACPDGIWCDADSRLWIQTDIGESAQLNRA
jgi:uncharacterized protein